MRGAGHGADGGVTGGKGAEHAARIMEALRGSPKPLGAYELLERLRPSGVTAPLTVYRALDRLIQAGQAHRIESLNAFVACQEGRHDHVHAPAGDTGHAPDRTVGFAICDSCGAVEEFVDPVLSDRVREDLSARAFVPRTSALEVHGLCVECSGKA